jgi:hypothetical protein
MLELVMALYASTFTKTCCALYLVFGIITYYNSVQLSTREKPWREAVALQRLTSPTGQEYHVQG